MRIDNHEDQTGVTRRTYCVAAACFEFLLSAVYPPYLPYRVAVYVRVLLFVYSSERVTRIVGFLFQILPQIVDLLLLIFIFLMVYLFVVVVVDIFTFVG